MSEHRPLPPQIDGILFDHGLSDREPTAAMPPAQPPARAAARPAPVADYNAIFDRVFADVVRHEESFGRERDEAPELLERLREQPLGRCKLLIRNSRRFQTWALCHLLIETSHRQGFSDPAESRDLAELATEVAERLSRDWYGNGPVEDIKAAAWAQLGNAWRILSDLRKADEVFGIAEHFLARGTGDPLERARFLDLKASLRRYQRRLTESAELLDAAIGLYREVGDEQREARALIKKGIVLEAAGDPAGAVEVVRASLALIDPKEDPRLAFYGQHNLIVFLSESGRYLEAQSLLAETRRLHRRFGDELNLLRLYWAEAKIAHGLGRYAEAEAAYLVAQRGFMRRGIGYNAALIALELAALYARQGRTEEMRRLAVEMMPIFRSRDVHREALAALLIFHQAVEQEAVTRSLIDEVHFFLTLARENPRLRFSPTS